MLTDAANHSVRRYIRPRVLVVDDEDAVRTYAERALQHGGYDPVVAADGPAALAIVQQAPPFDAFILDLAMPQKSGDARPTSATGRPGREIALFHGVRRPLIPPEANALGEPGVLRKTGHRGRVARSRLLARVWTHGRVEHRSSATLIPDDDSDHRARAGL